MQASHEVVHATRKVVSEEGERCRDRVGDRSELACDRVEQRSSSNPPVRTPPQLSVRAVDASSEVYSCNGALRQAED